MSSPVDRLADTDKVSPYAPKWARDLDGGSGQHLAGLRPHMTGGGHMVPIVPAVSPNFEAERLQPPGSLDPVVMPDPPVPESWLRNRKRSSEPGSRIIGTLFPLLLAIFLAALIAFVIVVEFPKIESYVARQGAAADSFATRFGSNAPRPLAGPSTTAIEPKPAGAVRSDNVPTSADRPIAAINPAAAPVVRPSPAWPTAPVDDTPAPASSAPAPSPPDNPAPIVIAPPAANLAPSAGSVPITSVKTVPIQPKKLARPLGQDEIETLLKQGKDFVSVGDFASARLVFGRIWEANDARGALALAATYDPIVLASIGAKGATPDVAKSREWYSKAQDLGSPDAAPRLEALAKSTR